MNPFGVDKGKFSHIEIRILKEIEKKKFKISLPKTVIGTILSPILREDNKIFQFLSAFIEEDNVKEYLKNVVLEKVKGQNVQVKVFFEKGQMEFYLCVKEEDQASE